MSNAKAVISKFGWPQGEDQTKRNIIVRGTVAISIALGTLYPVGGFPLNWTAAGPGSSGLNAAGVAGNSPILSSYAASAINASGATIVQLPTEVDVWSAGNPPSGYTYVVDRSVGNLHIMVPSNAGSGASGPMVEFGGIVTTAMINDAIQFCAIFPIGL